MHQSVAVIIVNEQNEILLQQRNDFKNWGLPGGIIEPDETPEAAAIREVKEETGFDVVVLRKIAEYLRPQIPGGEQLLHVFVVKPIVGVLNPDNYETAALRWAAINNIPKPYNPYLEYYFQDYQIKQQSVIKRTLMVSWLWGISMQILFLVRTIYFNIRDRIK
jgi:mutator protein MutT